MDAPKAKPIVLSVDAKVFLADLNIVEKKVDLITAKLEKAVLLKNQLSDAENN